MNAGRPRPHRKLFSRVVRPTEEQAPREREPETGHQSATEPAPTGDGFDEERYLMAYPDIAEAVTQGVWESGRAHYFTHGVREGRLIKPEYLGALPSRDGPDFPLCHVDTVLISPNGWCLVIGWIADTVKPLRAIAWSKGNEIVAATDCIARCRREDAEPAASVTEGKLLGFWTMFHTEQPLAPSETVRLHLWVDNNDKTFDVSPRYIDDQQLRDHACAYLASSRYFFNYQVEAFRQLKGGLGNVLSRHNKEISTDITRGAHVMRFGDHARRLDGSIIVCLFGKPEYLFLQAAAFSACPGIERYEFIYVSNSPELAERLSQEATMASQIYGVDITLVLLPGNAGFGAANNAAAAQARSDRLLVVNPDVFPRERDWPTRHSAIVADLPPEQTKLFGVPLYYDDGSLMHAGMYFDFDVGLSVHAGRVDEYDMIRVEHYAKGAPPATPAFLTSRAVPAVTGAFMSIDRAWFETLGGFSPDYVFGHYEDADLCLRSVQHGQTPWMHCVPFWHLEGKGAVRHPAHEGGSMVNRWRFTDTWRDFILDGLVGRSPTRLVSDGLAEPPAPRRSGRSPAMVRREAIS